MEHIFCSCFHLNFGSRFECYYSQIWERKSAQNFRIGLTTLVIIMTGIMKIVTDDVDVTDAGDTRVSK